MKGKFTAKVKLNGRARDNRSLLPEAIGIERPNAALGPNYGPIFV
jgi:hypothetical protein